MNPQFRSWWIRGATVVAAVLLFPLGLIVGRLTSSEEDLTHELAATRARLGNVERELAQAQASNEELEDQVFELRTELEASQPTPDESPEEAYPYSGYPKVVKKEEVPSQMRDSIDGPLAVAVAPGVWTQKIPGVSPEEAAQSGAFVGYCAAVEKAIEKLENESGYTCW